MQPLKALAISLIALATIAAAPALAAERVVLRYRGFSRSVPVEDLAILAETGEAPRSVAGLLRQAGQDPSAVQSALNRPIPADPVMLDRALNSVPGGWLLDQVGETIRPAAGGRSRQALRSALVLSAADDNQITLIEVLQNYPTAEVVLEGDRIHSTYNRLAQFLRPLSILL
ncbi:alpha/beta hydrolase [Nodosilinea sp. P-1105]|nr:alpha/beta hydrolase [Nodosilinea sp. P-1105]NMF86769.1 alpha/beta hydrolase [Nodosilinea sp. P-1105]